MPLLQDNYVLHCSSVNDWFLEVASNACLTDLIRLSTTRFCWVAQDTFHSHLNVHENLFDKTLWILGICQPCITSLKYKSHQQLIGWPLSDTNRQNVMRTLSVLLLATSSKWIALVLMQVNIITCASLRVLRPTLTWKGPNMSNAMLLNAGNRAATRSLGSWPISCPMGFRCSFLNVTHLLVTWLAIFWTPTIQKHFLDS